MTFGAAIAHRAQAFGMRVLAVAAAMAAGGLVAGAQSRPAPPPSQHGRLFPPQDLGLLPRCDVLLTGYVGDAALADDYRRYSSTLGTRVRALLL